MSPDFSSLVPCTSSAKFLLCSARSVTWVVLDLFFSWCNQMRERTEIKNRGMIQATVSVPWWREDGETRRWTEMEVMGKWIREMQRKCKCSGNITASEQLELGAHTCALFGRVHPVVLATCYPLEYRISGCIAFTGMGSKASVSYLSSFLCLGFFFKVF